MRTLETRNGKVSLARKRRMDVLGKGYLLFRPGYLEQHLKPICVRTPIKCALSGKMIQQGEYAYPCYENPVRVSPNGTAKALVDEVERRGRDIFAEGFFPYPIPSCEQLVSQIDIRHMENKRAARLSQQATKLLKAGRVKE